LVVWGLIPPKIANDPRAPRPIHARAETVAELSIFADAFRHRRAAVPVTTFYQQRTRGSPAGRYAIMRRDGQPMAIADLWEAFVGPDDQAVRPYCIITVEATGPVAHIHDRMPLVLEEEDLSVWLGDVPGHPATLLRPPAGDVLVVRPLPMKQSTRARSSGTGEA
jgi:putative SOS response-associated peptidase YedK